MRRADEREIEIARKSAISGFAAASVLLVVFLLYGLIVRGDHSPQLLIILERVKLFTGVPEYTMKE